jgi:hypothetical protein
LAGGSPTMTVLSQPADKGPSALSASRSTSAWDIASTRFQSILLSPRAILRLILSAENRAIFSFFRISCPPEGNKPDGLHALGPYDSEKSIRQQPDGHKAFLAVTWGRLCEYRAPVEQLGCFDQIQAVVRQIDRALLLVPLRVYRPLYPQLCT